MAVVQTLVPLPPKKKEDKQSHSGAWECRVLKETLQRPHVSSSIWLESKNIYSLSGSQLMMRYNKQSEPILMFADSFQVPQLHLPLLPLSRQADKMAQVLSLLILMEVQITQTLGHLETLSHPATFSW
jgi:hypothetical protein